MRRPLTFSSAIVAGSLLAVVGCWTITTDLDLGGGSGDSDSDSGLDGGAQDRASGDAPTDVLSIFDSVRPDALPDGAPLGLCDGHPIPPRLCDDFDLGVFGAKWTRIEMGGQGAPQLGTIAKSAPNAFSARVANGCSGGDWAQLIAQAPVKPAEAKVDFDLSIAPITGQLNLSVAGIEVLTAAAPGFYRFDLAFRDRGLELYENPPFTVLQRSTKEFAFDTFKHVSMSVVFVGTPRLTVTVDGVVEIDTPIKALEPNQDRTSLEMGAYTGAPCGSPVDVRIDNVLYFLKPR